MHRHIIYAAFAMMLGVAIMLLPLMVSYQNGFITRGWPQRGEVEKAFTPSEEKTEGNIVSKKNLNYTAVQEYGRLSMRFASSLPHAVFIVAMGLVAATIVLLLAKRRPL